MATPIGNLGDITLRALETLRGADVIAAEDTRHTLKLLNHYGISKPLISYWGEKEKVKAEVVIERLMAGQSVALLSDAGTPGISDPGAVLIRRAIEEGVEVVALPGPSALIAALSVSGLSTEEFTFIGFLPPKAAERRKRLRELALEPRTLIFYEAPHRIVETLADMQGAMGGQRDAALLKELTKLHEGALRGSLSVICEKIEETTIAGEYIIVVEGRKGRPHTIDEAAEEVRAMMKKGLGRKEAVRTVASQYGLSKNELYDRSLQE